ncbi:DUF1653 domain-containing protein [Paenibacillus sp. Mc5Re-14]|uniref:DUF1653 domain-containing protein n=1 Tax=Paenibacillus sp. Mc5Re-14 TaxID=1030529 RepID=UPI000AB33FDE|nr:DUF1653 domain-containing protein [Paenibacillus sp. Mc5Re-14]
MFYRHYKGGIYYTLGLTSLYEGTGLEREWTHNYLSAIHTETGRKIAVSLIDGRFHVLDEEDTNLVLYLDMVGRFWLRPRDIFFETVKVDGKEIRRFLNYYK